MLDPRIEKYFHKRAMQKSRYLADKAMNCRNRQKYDKAIEALEKILTLLPAVFIKKYCRKYSKSVKNGRGHTDEKPLKNASNTEK